MHEKEAPRKSETATFPLLLVAWQKALTTSKFKIKMALQISLFYSILRKVANFQ